MESKKHLPEWDATAEYRGEWWPPEQPELRYSGFLRFDQRRPKLTVETPPVGQESFQLGRVPTLHGVLATGEPVTLWDLQDRPLIHEQMKRGDQVRRHRRTFTYAISGEHYGGYENQLFRYSAVRFHGLDTWSRIPEPIPKGTPEMCLPQHASARLIEPYRDMFDLQYTVDVRIEHPMRVETDEYFPGGAIMDHPGDHVRLLFECDPPAPAAFHDLLLQDAQALLTFCYQTGAPVVGEWLAAEEPARLGPVLRRDSFGGAEPTRQGWHQMILTTRGDSFQRLVPAWWNGIEELFPAPQVVTMYHHSSRGLLEQSTASAIAAAEHLHGLIGATQTRFEDGYLAARQRELLESYSGDKHKEFRRFLREKLKEDRPVLATRLRELLAALTRKQLDELRLDEAAWIRDVKDVRNKLAHTAAHVPRRGDSGVQLDRVNVETRALLTLLILSSLGVDGTALDRAANVLATEIQTVRK